MIEKIWEEDEGKQQKSLRKYSTNKKKVQRPIKMIKNRKRWEKNCKDRYIQLVKRMMIAYLIKKNASILVISSLWNYYSQLKKIKGLKIYCP